jgi:hypothetical protein
MALESTQPLVKMSTRAVPGSKGGRCVRLTSYHHIMPMSRNLGALTLLDPSGPAWPVMDVLYLYLLLFITLTLHASTLLRHLQGARSHVMSARYVHTGPTSNTNRHIAYMATIRYQLCLSVEVFQMEKEERLSLKS